MTPDELRAAWPKIESRLVTADILLFHKRKGPITRLIQSRTESYWSHAALVFVPKKELTFGGPLIVEATYGGIEIHQMKKYSDHPESYDIGVLRYPGCSDAIRKQIVMSFILNHIDVSYDYSRLIALFLRPLLMTVSSELYSWVLRHVIHRQNFVCSTFVHQAFRELHHNGRVVSPRRTQGTALLDPVPYEEMIAPGHLTLEPHFRWVFNPQK